MAADPGDDVRLLVDDATPEADVAAATRSWVETHVPDPWRRAAVDGIAAIRSVRKLGVPFLRPVGLPDWPFFHRVCAGGRL